MSWLAFATGCNVSAVVLAFRLGVRVGRRRSMLPQMPRRAIYQFSGVRPQLADVIPIWGYRRLRRRARAAMHPRPAGALAAGASLPYERPELWPASRSLQCEALEIPPRWIYWVPFIGRSLLRRHTRAKFRS